MKSLLHIIVSIFLFVAAVPAFGVVYQHHLQQLRLYLTESGLTVTDVRGEGDWPYTLYRATVSFDAALPEFQKYWSTNRPLKLLAPKGGLTRDTRPATDTADPKKPTGAAELTAVFLTTVPDTIGAEGAFAFSSESLAARGLYYKGGYNRIASVSFGTGKPDLVIENFRFNEGTGSVPVYNPGDRTTVFLPKPMVTGATFRIRNAGTATAFFTTRKVSKPYFDGGYATSFNNDPYSIKIQPGYDPFNNSRNRLEDYLKAAWILPGQAMEFSNVSVFFANYYPDMPGLYPWTITADLFNVVQESREDNNSLSGTLSLPPGTTQSEKVRVNLTLKASMNLTNIRKDEIVRVSYQVSNSGNWNINTRYFAKILGTKTLKKPSGAQDLNMSAVSGRTLSSAISPLIYFYGGNSFSDSFLISGQVSRGGISEFVPGDYEILLRLDSQEALQEDNETDNDVILRFTVKP